MFRTLFIFGGFVGHILVGRILAFVKALWHPAAEFLVVPIASLLVGVLGAGRSSNGKKSGDLCETHDGYQDVMIVLLSRKLMI